MNIPLVLVVLTLLSACRDNASSSIKDVEVPSPLSSAPVGGLEGRYDAGVCLPVTPARTSVAERHFIQKAYAHIPDLASEYLDALPETRPIIHRIVPDNAGHLFVLVDIAGALPGTVVDVFRDGGQYLGRLLLPRAVVLPPRSSTPLLHADSEYLLAVVRDELEVPYVSRLRIVRPGGGLPPK